MKFGHNKGQAKPSLAEKAGQFAKDQYNKRSGSGKSSGQKQGSKKGPKRSQSGSSNNPSKGSSKNPPEQGSLRDRASGVKEGAQETSEGVKQLAKGGAQLGTGVSRISSGDVVGGAKDVYKGFRGMKDGAKQTGKGMRDTVDSARGQRKTGGKNKEEREQDGEEDKDQIEQGEDELDADGNKKGGDSALKKTMKNTALAGAAHGAATIGTGIAGIAVIKAAIDAAVGFLAMVWNGITSIGSAIWSGVTAFAANAASVVGSWIASAGAWLGGALGIGTGAATAAVGVVTIGTLISAPVATTMMIVREISDQNNPAKWEHRVGLCGDELGGRGGLAAGGYPAYPTDKDKYPLETAVSSPYGWRSYNGGEFHDGVDIAGGWPAEGKAPIYATRAGEVVYAHNTGHSGGWGILIRHEVEDKLSQYYHLYQNSLMVKKGEKVKKGQEIAKMGNTGGSTGPHLHFMIIEGKHYPQPFPYQAGMDPADYLKEAVSAGNAKPDKGGGGSGGGRRGRPGRLGGRRGGGRRGGGSSAKKGSTESGSGSGATFNVNDISTISQVPQGMENAQKLYSVMRKLGFPEDVMAVFMSHLAYESSGFDSTAVETIYDEPYEIGRRKQAAEKANFYAPRFVPDYHARFPGVKYMGLGLSQWSNGRNRQLLDYADLVGSPWHEFGTQIAFMFDEKRGDGYDFKNLTRVAKEEGNSGNYEKIARRLWNEYFRGAGDLKENRIALSARDGKKLKAMFKVFKYDEKYAASVLKGIETGKLNLGGRYGDGDECGPTEEEIQATDGVEIDGLLIQSTGKFRKMLEVLKKTIGAEYKAGATVPPKGDNPGKFGTAQLVSWAFKEAYGNDVPSNTAELYKQSEYIRRGSQHPGDLVFYYLTEDGGASTVGIYVGDDRVVMATVDGVKLYHVDQVNKEFTNKGYTFGRLKNLK